MANPLPGWPAVAIGRDAGRSAPARSVLWEGLAVGVATAAPGTRSGVVTETTDAMLGRAVELGRAVGRSCPADEPRSPGVPTVPGMR